MTLIWEAHNSTDEASESTGEGHLPHWEDAAQEYTAARMRFRNARARNEQAQAQRALDKSRATLGRIFEQIWPDRSI